MISSKNRKVLDEINLELMTKYFENVDIIDMRVNTYQHNSTNLLIQLIDADNDNIVYSRIVYPNEFDCLDNIINDIKNLNVVKCINKESTNNSLRVELDKHIKSDIEVLNMLGYRTIGCCEGHSYSTYSYDGFILPNAYILFKDPITNCPDGWNTVCNGRKLVPDYIRLPKIIEFAYKNSDYYMDNNIILKHYFNKYKKEYLESLHNWVQELLNSDDNE